MKAIRFKDLKIRYRLVFSYTIILLLSITIGIIAMSGLKDANADLNNFINTSYTADTSIKNARIYANIMARTVRDLVIDPDVTKIPSYEEKIIDQASSIEDMIVQFKESYPKKDGLAEKYENAYYAWKTIGLSIVEEVKQGNIDTAETMIIEQCTPALNNLIEVAKEIDLSTGQIKNDMVANSLKSTTMITYIVLGLLIAAVLFSIWISAIVTKSITKPVQEVQDAVIQLSKGNLNTHFTHESKDELGVMLEKMTQSFQTIAAYIHDIDVALQMMADGDFNIYATVPFVGDFKSIETNFINFSLKMSETLQQINMAAEQVNTGSTQVADGAQALSQGATEQAASVQQLSATIAEVAKHIQETSDKAQIANDLSQKTGAGVTHGNQKMLEMIAAMEEISTKSSETGKIIKTIDDIAFQTNILALNAAVEAARAGAAGKGFAVVADEVRNLAGKSADAAKNTTLLIQGTLEAINDGAKIADETAKYLKAIVSDSETATSMMAEIASAAQIQASSVEQIRIGVDQISSVVQTNSATAEESAATSEELSGQSNLMHELISEFKLREN